MPQTELVKLSDDGLIAQALKPSSMKRSIAEMVPDDLEPHQALANIRELVGGLNTLGNATSVVGALLGAHMALMAKRDDLLGASGYDTIKEFEEAEIIGRLSHGSAYNWARIARTWPDAPIKQLLEAGSTNLLKAAKVLPPDASPGQREEFLEKAVEMNGPQFTAWVESTGLVSPGDTTTKAFSLIGTTREVIEVKEKLCDPQILEAVREVLGNDDRPIAIILVALALLAQQGVSAPVQTGEQHVNGEAEGWA